MRASSRGSDAQRLYISPASLLGLQVLLETGRLRVRGSIAEIASDERVLDDRPRPPG